MRSRDSGSEPTVLRWFLPSTRKPSARISHWSALTASYTSSRSKAGHAFDDTDFDRLINYVDAFEQFFKENQETVAEFYRAWRIDLVADGEKLKKSSNRHAFGGFVESNRVRRMSWRDFLTRAKKVHEQFLDIHDLGTEKRQRKKA